MKKEQLQAIAAYSPSYLARQIAAQPGVALAGRAERFHAAVLFSDVSGFTAMSEGLAKIGKQGAEELTRVLNDYFTVMIEIVHAYGGSVARFGGDAITVFFPVAGADARHLEGDGHLELAARVHAAMTCGLEMLARMGDFAAVETAGGTFTLRMKIGVSAGPLLALSVGSVEEGLEYVLAGRALDVMSECEHHANPGELVADARTIDRVADVVTLDEERDGFAVVRAVSAETSTLTGTSEVRAVGLDELAREQRTQVAYQLSLYFPPTIYERVMTGQTAFVNEHRKVTSIFVSFTGLNYDGDPDVARKAQEYFTEMQQVINRYGGRLNRLLTGDKGSLLHVIFGAPVSHEDDVLRAVGCALEMNRAVGELPFITGQRIGVSTGYVFAGAVGSATRQEYTIMGDVVNLSARLMQAAMGGLGAVVVSAAVREETAEWFVLNDLGQIRVKGKAEPLAVYEPVKQREMERRLHISRRGEIVGRKTERTRIRDLLAQTRAGRGQILTISGETGVGKSRLAGELARVAVEELGMTGFGGDCLSYGGEIPYLPWTDILTSFLGLSAQQDRAQKVAMVEMWLRAIDPALVVRLPLLSDILGLGVPDNETTKHFDAKLRQQSTTALIWELLQHRAQEEAYLLLFEDAHWMDSLSWELVNYAARNMADLPIMLVLVHRPLVDKAPAVYSTITAHSHHTTLALEDLSPEESLELARHNLGVSALPAELEELVIGKGQGNPFFTEEILQTLRETGALVVEDSACRLVGKIDEVILPDNVHGVVQARIDRLPESSKLTLKVAAVIGRLFRESLLAGVYPIEVEREQLRRDLSRLDGQEFTLLERPVPELEYLFKHLITQEVAYESLLFAHRHDLHQRVGEFLEQRYRDSLAEVYELLAYHYGRTDNDEKALTYAVKAGGKAQAVYANAEALAYYGQALEIWQRQAAPDTDTGTDLRLRRGDIYLLTGEYDAAAQEYTYALEQGSHIGLPLPAADVPVQQARALNKLSEVAWRKGDFDQAQEHADRAYHATEDVQQRAISLFNQGMVSYRVGDYDTAVQRQTRAYELFARAEDAAGQARAFMNIGNPYYSQGAYTDALKYWTEAVKIYERLGDKEGLSKSLNNAGTAYQYLSEYTEALQTLNRALQISQEIGDTEGIISCSINLATVSRYLGEYAQSLQNLQKALFLTREIGDKYFESISLTDTGETYRDQEDYHAAEHYYAEALTVSEAINDREGIIWNLVGLGESRWGQGDYAAALNYTQRGLALAEELNSKDMKARALRVLGMIYADMPAAPASTDGAFAESVRILREVNAPGEIGKSLVPYGRYLLRKGETARGEERLAEAREIFVRLGMKGELAKLVNE